MLGDGVQDGAASEQEMRTPTLWNLRTRDPMLHTGAASGGLFADRVTIAINAHGPFGEAAASAAAFAGLGSSARNGLIAFLDSLGRDEYDFNGDKVITMEDFQTLVACKASASISPDDNCAIGDINQDGVVNTTDFDGFLLSFARAGYEVDLDCDGDGTVDLAEIFNGAPDTNNNAVPDACECVGDFDNNGSVSASDLATLLGLWGSPGGDLDNDGMTAASDLATLLGNWGSCN